MTALRPVVVTGIGMVSCLGHDLDTITAALRLGRAGIGIDPQRVELGFRSPLTGVIPTFDPRDHLTRKERRSMNEPAIYAGVAAVRALADGELDRARLSSPRVGVVFGNDSTCGSSVAVVDTARADGTTRNLGASAVIRSMNSVPTMNLSVLFGTQGANWTVSSACASSSHAIGQAALLIASGQQDVMLTGGSQEVNWMSMAGFDGQGTLSTRTDSPSTASRPFSADRDGLVPSGGAAVLILESEEHAVARGAHIRARIRAWSFSSDGHHITTPHGRGAVRAMRTALDQARVTPAEVEYISAHATSTPIGDAVEARAIGEVFGPATPPISSTKGLTGHECWMAGGAELAYALLAAEAGFIPANNALVQPDDAFSELDLVRETREGSPRLILSNSFGFGGTNSCLLVERP